MVLCNRNMSSLKCVYNQKYIFRGGDGFDCMMNNEDVLTGVMAPTDRD
jgi:hypothetical protein